MKVPLTPEYLEELAAGYVVGDLSSEEAEEFQQLLRECPELIVQVGCLHEVLSEVLYGLNEVQPPPDLGSTILEAAKVSANSTSKFKWFPLSWGKVVGSVAALLILVLSVANYRLRQELSIAQAVPTMLQHSQTRLFSLKGTNRAVQASGKVVMDLEQQRIAIVIRNLPTPPTGQIYRLWAVVDGQKIPCGQSIPSSHGIVLDKLSVPADLYNEVSELIVTLEPSVPAPDPVGPIVMKSFS